MNPEISPAGVFIRDVQPNDAEAITAIYRDAVLFGTASWEYDPPSVEGIAERIGAVTSKDYPYLVAEADGRVAGYAYASAYRPRIGYRFTVEDSVYVNPAFQRRGIGRALLAALVERCRTAGFRNIVAVIGDSANAPSIELHRAVGFVHAGTLRNIGFKHERWLDSVLMQKEL